MVSSRCLNLPIEMQAIMWFTFLCDIIVPNSAFLYIPKVYYPFAIPKGNGSQGSLDLR